MAEDSWKFKEGARVPAGVTAADIAAEKALIEKDLGRGASVEEAVARVMESPDQFPAHRAFGAKDAETALWQSVEQGIRYCWRNVVRVHVKVYKPPTKTTRAHVTVVPARAEVRAWFPVPSEPEAPEPMVYESLEVIAESPAKEAHLTAQLSADATAYARKAESVLAELAALKAAQVS